MRILYLSKNIENYKAANYQKEFLNALSKTVNLFIYGPGYSNFDKNKNYFTRFIIKREKIITKAKSI